MQLLMRPDAEVLTILGTGRQALSHYNVFMEIFPFKEVIELEDDFFLSVVNYSILFQFKHHWP